MTDSTEEANRRLSLMDDSQQFYYYYAGPDIMRIVENPPAKDCMAVDVCKVGHEHFAIQITEALRERASHKSELEALRAENAEMKQEAKHYKEQTARLQASLRFLGETVEQAQSKAACLDWSHINRDRLAYLNAKTAGKNE